MIGYSLTVFSCFLGQYEAAPDDHRCPPGHYCPTGTPYPQPCPIGTFSDVRGNENETQCQSCHPGKFIWELIAWAKILLFVFHFLHWLMKPNRVLLRQTGINQCDFALFTWILLPWRTINSTTTGPSVSFGTLLSRKIRGPTNMWFR